jgi:hypothetical protein|tara:strand:+ start:337 stop:579 length:243 start_codon:yes stop_codon:yes gene_type:complete
MTNDFYKQLVGTGGALVLATVILFQTMNRYDVLIQEMIQDSKEDRQMYEKTMTELTVQIQMTNETLKSIQRDIEKISTTK